MSLCLSLCVSVSLHTPINGSHVSMCPCLVDPMARSWQLVARVERKAVRMSVQERERIDGSEQTKYRVANVTHVGIIHVVQYEEEIKLLAAGQKGETAWCKVMDINITLLVVHWSSLARLHCTLSIGHGSVQSVLDALRILTRSWCINPCNCPLE